MVEHDRLSRFRSVRYCRMEYPLKPHWLVASSLGCFHWLGCWPRCSAQCVQGWPSCHIFFYWLGFYLGGVSLRKVNTCKYLPIGSIIILPDDVYKSSKIMLPKEGLCL